MCLSLSQRLIHTLRYTLAHTHIFINISHYVHSLLHKSPDSTGSRCQSGAGCICSRFGTREFLFPTFKSKSPWNCQYCWMVQVSSRFSSSQLSKTYIFFQSQTKGVLKLQVSEPEPLFSVWAVQQSSFLVQNMFIIRFWSNTERVKHLWSNDICPFFTCDWQRCL